MPNSCHVNKVFFFFSSTVSNRKIRMMHFFSFFNDPSHFFSFLVMSDAPNSQQQSPPRFPVQVHPGYPILPPIPSTNHTVKQENSSSDINTVDVACEKISIDVKDFWVKLREHINSDRLKSYDKHGIQRTSNKVVRIFVSSTFTDFFNEREVLIKKVFPALREEMGPSGIQIIDCDLRWGVNMIK